MGKWKKTRYVDGGITWNFVETRDGIKDFKTNSKIILTPYFNSATNKWQVHLHRGYDAKQYFSKTKLQAEKQAQQWIKQFLRG